MTTQADITLALTNVNTTATTLQTRIATLINAIADQDSISASKKLDPAIIAAVNTAAGQIAALVTAIGTTAGASAV